MKRDEKKRLGQLVEALLRVVDLLHVPQGEAHAPQREVRSLRGWGDDDRQGIAQPVLDVADVVDVLKALWSHRDVEVPVADPLLHGTGHFELRLDHAILPHKVHRGEDPETPTTALTVIFDTLTEKERISAYVIIYEMKVCAFPSFSIVF